MEVNPKALTQNFAPRSRYRFFSLGTIVSFRILPGAYLVLVPLKLLTEAFSKWEGRRAWTQQFVGPPRPEPQSFPGISKCPWHFPRCLQCFSAIFAVAFLLLVNYRNHWFWGFLSTSRAAITIFDATRAQASDARTTTHQKLNLWSLLFAFTSQIWLHDPVVVKVFGLGYLREEFCSEPHIFPRWGGRFSVPSKLLKIKSCWHYLFDFFFVFIVLLALFHGQIFLFVTNLNISFF